MPWGTGQTESAPGAKSGVRGMVETTRLVVRELVGSGEDCVGVGAAGAEEPPKGRYDRKVEDHEEPCDVVEAAAAGAVCGDGSWV